MSAPASRAAPRFATLISHVWWVLLLVALGLLWLASERRIARVDAISDSPPWSVDPPLRDASSPTGYAHGQRKLIVPGNHNPSFRWIMEAQQAAAHGALRLRHIDYDAAPEGRKISRTSPYRWWLIAVGWVRGALASEPLGFAIERGALVADPILLGLMLVVGGVYAARYLGAVAAIGLVVGGISLFPLAANFQPGAPDPHALAWVFALGSILPLLVPPRNVGPRLVNHFVLAGIFGGLGFWNDATTQAPVLLAIFLGAVGGEFIRKRGAATASVAPLRWRAWAAAGALTTLGASAFEFAPDHFSWSLDSVSPIHALTWWGLGEVLHAAGIWLRERRRKLTPREAVLLVAALGAIAAWPIAGFWSGSGALLASDFYALELANHPRGVFASNLGAWLKRAEDSGAKWATLLPGILLIVVLARICFGRIEREARARLVLVWGAALFAAVLAHIQLRWWNLFDVLALALLAAYLAESKAGDGWSRFRALSATLLVVPGLFVGFPKPVNPGEAARLSSLEAQAAIARDFAYWLVKRGGTEPNVLFSTPVFSGAAAFYGGFNVVTSSDGTNETGQLTAVRIASATTVQEVSILLNSRGITHVALPLWDPALDQLVRTGLDLPAGQPLPPSAFSVALRAWDMPLWMRPMDYLIPRQPGFESFELRAFALGAEQEPDLALSRLADFFVERGQIRDAQALRKSLEVYPRSVVALGAIASVDLALRDRARLKESLDAVVPQLSRRAARTLPEDRRISLATLLLQTNRSDLARTQLVACFETLDAETIRKLTPGALVSLFALSRSLDVPFPNQELQAKAWELTPPGVRASLAK